MRGKLTTHVLDTAHGCPADGMNVALYLEKVLIAKAFTNADGRIDGPMIAGEHFVAGVYHLEFAVGDYFAARGHPDAKRFLDVVPVVFRVDDPTRNYHVPLLVSPWAYSTYRGS
jgi:5-hydroxyisourate hydrolase